MQPFFVTSPGTDIGKTLVTAALCHQLRATGRTVTALKPVISGYDEKDQESDTAIILRSCGLTPTPSLMETIAPWRFAAPLAPAMAAAREDKTIDLEAVLAFCREHTTVTSDVLIVEGAGGVMAPLNSHHTMLDVMAPLGWPALLVAGTYLGALSHTLTAHAVLAAHGIPVRAVVASESLQSTVSLDETAEMLKSYLPGVIPVVKIPRIAAMESPWECVPLIHWLCDV